MSVAQTIAFLGFSFLIIVSGISMLSTEKIVHSAVYLLMAMLGTAGIFVMLEAEFLAIMQVTIYAGAVMVLILFTIMLTLTRIQEMEQRREVSYAALLVAALFGVMIYLVLGGWPTRVRPFAPGAAQATNSTVARLGELLFTGSVLPFELASLVLLAALIGAIFITLEDRS